MVIDNYFVIFTTQQDAQNKEKIRSYTLQGLTYVRVISFEVSTRITDQLVIKSRCVTLCFLTGIMYLHCSLTQVHIIIGRLRIDAKNAAHWISYVHLSVWFPLDGFK
jgi:hypothetical protein